MGKHTHTPGPWTDKGGSAGAVWAGEEFLASVYPTAQAGWDGNGRFDRQDETEANARLIAAAPDLLEALKACEAWIVELADSGDAGFWDASKAPEVIQARAAIRRAQGEGSE